MLNAECCFSAPFLQVFLEKRRFFNVKEVWKAANESFAGTGVSQTTLRGGAGDIVDSWEV